MSSDETGVVVPPDSAGRPSSSALGRTVVADALRGVDPVAAAAAEGETNWRSGYLSHFRRLVQAGLPSREASIAVASDGLHSIHRQLLYRRSDGAEAALDAGPLDAMSLDGTGPPLSTVEIKGTGTAETSLSLPVGGTRLSGDALARQLDDWIAAGVLEPSAADRVRLVMANPEWLRLDGHTVVVLGAGAEMGPLSSLLRWGARVAALDLPLPQVWERVLATAREQAGTLLVPVGPDSAGRDHDGDAGGDLDADSHTAAHAGLDLMSDIAAAAEWIRGRDGRLVLGNYVYADGVRNLRLCAAVDALSVHLQAELPDLALAFLATPTDVFAVPPEAVAHALKAHQDRSLPAKLLAAPVRTLSAGRLMRRPYPPDERPGIHDALVRQQGPNYALAKRLQRWRATVARASGSTVSMNVAPPSRTRSVLKNRVLAAAYATAHRFGVTVFEPETANTLMAALLVADLHTDGGPRHDEPWQDESYSAVHGGMWRCPYEPRSVLGLAAVMGYRAAGR
ncbi:MAG: hypothetical protein QOJ37_2325 [Pseudonocardiales bacterium]|nr:hypothetical protein [Pseudonocardiales bacterium]